MDERTPQLPGDHSPTLAQRLAKFAKPALIAGALTALTCGALLLIIAGLDAFNATVYSAGGKSINDETNEARQIRELYSGARTGGTIFLTAALLAASAGGVIAYLNRNAGRKPGESDGGEAVDFDELGR